MPYIGGGTEEDYIVLYCLLLLPWNFKLLLRTCAVVFCPMAHGGGIEMGKKKIYEFAYLRRCHCSFLACVEQYIIV